MLEAIASVAALIEDADEIDDGLRAFERGAQERGLVHIAFVDLDTRGQLRAHVCIHAAAEHRHAVAGTEELRNEVTADEAGAAEDDDVACHRASLALRRADRDGRRLRRRGLGAWIRLAAR
ncbi:hypothetical protein GCM10007067_14630 [Lysobacter bugurensis]|uniref:Uncharacterized protein n=1 Tax=Cognatilysobacter bugurensis TaxID=543356 RepID=A0A918SY51_9GAMM|nr:hypothetical protein GCM10007067_14630 [Lysobacter bugurensis]